MAFSVPIGFSDFGALLKVRYCVAHFFNGVAHFNDFTCLDLSMVDYFSDCGEIYGLFYSKTVQIINKTY